MADSEAFCGGKLVQALLNQGHEAAVIFCSNTRNSMPADNSACWDSLRDVSIDIRNNATRSIVSKGWTALRYQSSGWSGWVEAAVTRAVALHAKTPFEIVISRSLPWHAHVAGYWVSSQLKLPWLANINDPWDLRPFAGEGAKEGLIDPNLQFWRSRLLRNAGAITFPCKRLGDYFVHKSNRRVLVVPHIGTAATSERSSDEFTLVHAGKLGVGDMTGRSIQPLLESFRRFLADRPSAAAVSCLEFVGALDPDAIRMAEDFGVADRIRIIGTVSYEESLKNIARAAACVLVEGNFREGIFLPSKLCDYIAARKPVIAFSPETGTVNDFAKKGGIYRVAPRDSAGAAAVLTRMFDAFVEKNLPSLAPPEELISYFTAERVAMAFLDAVKLAREEMKTGKAQAKSQVKEFSLSTTVR
jgi:glycosyltransferase involved in cell wall biosynthesis